MITTIVYSIILLICLCRIDGELNIDDHAVDHINDCVPGKYFNRYHDAVKIKCIVEYETSKQCLPDSFNLGVHVINCR